MTHIVKISEAASLALHTMVYLASNSKKRISTKEIAESFLVSEAHLSKVLQRLRKEGYVKTMRGPKGGFTLGKPEKNISLLDIYETIEGKLKDEQCLLGTYVCGGHLCILGDKLKETNQGLRTYLENTKIADLTGVCKNLNEQRETKEGGVK